MAIRNTRFLIGIYCFNKSKWNKSAEWELVRFANLKDTNVIGAASKLLKAFRKDNKGSIISYADRRWSSSLQNLYTTLGFSKSNVNKPGYKLCKGASILSRHKTKRKELSRWLITFDSSLSEAQNLTNAGWWKIFDCGTITYILS